MGIHLQPGAAGARAAVPADRRRRHGGHPARAAPPGDSLPGSRTLARSLGVQRLTVIAAMEELVAEGWLVTRPARGTFVSPRLPDPRPRGPAPGAVVRPGIPDRVVFDVPPGPPGEMPCDAGSGALFFAPNRPDIRLIPHDLIGRAYRRAVRQERGRLLSYGRPQGHERLRAAIAAMLTATRGLAATPDDICITRGSQMGVRAPRPGPRAPRGHGCRGGPRLSAGRGGVPPTGSHGRPDSSRRGGAADRADREARRIGSPEGGPRHAASSVPDDGHAHATAPQAPARAGADRAASP